MLPAAQSAAGGPEVPEDPVAAVIFDLDGVLTDTSELHYRSWKLVADELGLSFDRQINDAMRGLSRPESLAILLRDQSDRFRPEEKARLAERKNAEYLRLLAQMTPGDLYPGTLELLRGLRARAVRVAVASSSRNASRVVERLGIGAFLDVIVDANTVPRSKPDPQVFLAAAERLAVPPRRCIVVEDAEAGVAAALAAGMRVVGIGPAERVGRAHLRVGAVAELDADRLVELLTE